ncbi:hypothetical protein [Lysobacter sp. CA199]|uniref:hypothetical protein n=1 Tax=Lysobacter sp. CA199 TaxID=3455608 RepID=UPI003F8D8AF3
MQPHTDQSPVTAQTPAVPSAGAVAQATTGPATPEQLQAYALACVEHFEANAARHRAEEIEYRALAKAHRADVHMVPADRLLLSLQAEQRGDRAGELANDALGRADALRQSFPGLPQTPQPMAVIVTTIQRDRIQQTARLIMGRATSASRTFTRLGNLWKCRDRDWPAHEEAIGVELVEHMEAFPLPDRVAEMLPRPSAPEAAAKAASEVRHG